MGLAQIEEAMAQLKDMLDAIIVKDEASRSYAIAQYRACLAWEDEIKAYWKDPKSKAHEAHKSVRAKEKKPLDVTDSIKTSLRLKVEAHDDSVLAIQTAHYNQLQAKEEARVRRERRRLLKRAENTKTPELKQALIEEANALVPALITPPTIAKRQNEYYKEDWTVEVVKPEELPDEWKVPDYTGLNAFVNETSGSKPIDGCRFRKKSRLVIKREKSNA